MTNSTAPRVRRSDRVRERSRSWRELALSRQLSRRAVKRARIQTVVLLPLLSAVLVVYNHRETLFGRAWDTPVRGLTAAALMALGWQLARDIGRAFGPTLFRRMDPSTAGTVGFLIRLLTVAVILVLALRIAGLDPRTLALGGAFTAVVVGLATQQTLGNVFAGTVLLSARPFRVGERIRLQGGGLAGEVEGIVRSLGLFYTTLASGEDDIMVPNSVVLNVAIIPLREPDGVELRARLRPGLTPLDVEEVLRERITTPLRGSPRVTLEELDGDEVVVRIGATPRDPQAGARLAGEVLEVVASLAARSDA
jgi:small-conductance mechanosensitive channel